MGKGVLVCCIPKVVSQRCAVTLTIGGDCPEQVASAAIVNKVLSPVDFFTAQVVHCFHAQSMPVAAL